MEILSSPLRRADNRRERIISRHLLHALELLSPRGIRIIGNFLVREIVARASDQGINARGSMIL